MKKGVWLINKRKESNKSKVNGKKEQYDGSRRDSTEKLWQKMNEDWKMMRREQERRRCWVKIKQQESVHLLSFTSSTTGLQAAHTHWVEGRKTGSSLTHTCS